MGKRDSLLWSVTKGEIHHEIFGTMHLAYKAISWPQEPVLEKLRLYKHYYGEMDLDEVLVDESAGYFLPENNSLRNLISEKKYSKIRHILIKAFQVDISDYDHYFPLFIQYQIDYSISTNQPFIPMDQFLWNKAKLNGSIMGGLESKATQVQILHNLSIDFQISTLKRIANNVSSYRKTIKNLIKSYENQEIESLKKKALRSMGRFKHLMVYNRNETMAEKIHQLANNSFITFGAGHLGGNKGVLALLKKKGWKIKPVKTVSS